jgi:hypothetical protein
MDKMHREMMVKGYSFTHALACLLKQVGFYSFNRWAVKQGLRLEYVLHLHQLAAKM